MLNRSRLRNLGVGTVPKQELQTLCNAGRDRRARSLMRVVKMLGPRLTQVHAHTRYTTIMSGYGCTCFKCTSLWTFTHSCRVVGCKCTKKQAEQLKKIPKRIKRLNAQICGVCGFGYKKGSDKRTHCQSECEASKNEGEQSVCPKGCLYAKSDAWFRN